MQKEMEKLDKTIEKLKVKFELAPEDKQKLIVDVLSKLLNKEYKNDSRNQNKDK
jgi:hypothetical protein